MSEEALASFAGGTATGLVAFLIESIRQEVSLLSEVPKKIDMMSKELRIVRGFLEDDARRGEVWDATKARKLKEWKQLVRDTAYKAEDVMDEFTYYMATFPPVRYVGFRKFAYSIITFPENHGIATHAKDILSEFKGISQLAQSYGLQNIEASLHGSTSHAHESSRHLRSERTSFPGNQDRPLVGFVGERDTLVSWLREEEPLRMVIAVKGMGGLGKTTLVHSAYCQVNTQYDCCAWITVSQSYSIIELLQKLIRQFVGRADDHMKDDVILIKQLFNHLEAKKYLIVLDDVWNKDLWPGLRSAFPINHRGSRVIVTTRNEEVASSLENPRREFSLQPLGPEDAWVLFCEEAFVSRICPSELERSAKAIVGRCGGLPLAIVAMAGLMASTANITVTEWNRVQHRLGWYLTNNHCETVLSLSFNELPYHLKHCFLYLSIFPEDYVMKKNKLIRLWIAEGFVEERSGWSREDKAEEYLKELVNRNLLQVSTRSSMRFKSYRMHDVMRELALWISKEEKFLVVHDGQEEKPCCHARRISIQTKEPKILDCTGKFHLHSILSFDYSPDLSFSMKKMWSHTKFLRVLDLEGARINKFPDGLDELLNLRYLSLRNTRVADLPKGFGRLLSLEIVDLRGTEMNKLPCRISTLQKLRHLYLPSASSGYLVYPGIPAPKGVCELTNLQTLAYIQADESIATNVGKLIQLRKFGISSVREVHSANLCSSIEKMEKLNNLSLTAEMGETLELEHLSRPPKDIHKLVLVAKLNSQLPKWVGSLDSLTRLSLRSSRLSQDPLPALQDLPSLEELELRDAFMGTGLVFREGSFQALKKLQLWDLKNLQGIVIERGTMPSIREMHFINCKQMKQRSWGEEYLRNVEIYASDMPAEFTYSLRAPC